MKHIDATTIFEERDAETGTFVFVLELPVPPHDIYDGMGCSFDVPHERLPIARHFIGQVEKVVSDEDAHLLIVTAEETPL